MSFISYAPNFEDVMLWRALGHVANGFYVDVGAADPHGASLTRAFYERGWRGMNLQGARAVHQALQIARPADTNLQVIAGEQEGIAAYLDSGDIVVQRQLPQQTLSALCARYGTADIHFMRIDLDGAEAPALAGLDLAACRPWVLVIASGAAAAWQERVLAARYERVYNDGACLYFVAAEHAALRAAFAYPPSVADGFVLRQDHPFAFPLTQWRQQVEQLKAARAAADAKAQEARDWAEARVRERDQAQADAIFRAEGVLREFYEAAIGEREAVIRAIHASTSWRITRPLRSIIFRARAMRRHLGVAAKSLRAGIGGLRGRIMGLLKGAVRRVVRAIMSRPKVSFFVRSQIGRHPRLTNWLRVVVQRTQATPAPVSMESPADLESLPLAARQVLSDLRRTIHNSRN